MRKRDKHKTTNPAKWDVSAAGHVVGATHGNRLDENPVSAAQREVNEGLGIFAHHDEMRAAQLCVMLMSNIGVNPDFGEYRDNAYQYIYLLKRTKRELQQETLANGIGLVARDLGSDGETACARVECALRAWVGRG